MKINLAKLRGGMKVKLDEVLGRRPRIYQRDIEDCMRHDAYVRDRGRLKQTRHG
jgi:hypothetical protein